MPGYQAYTDSELVALLQGSDQAAFTEIYNRYWDKLFAVAYHRLNNDLEAEETIQDIFLSLWQRRGKLLLTHTLATYLSVAVKYQIITRMARAKRERERLKTLPVPEQEATETTIEWLSEKELRRQLEASVLALPEKCRIVFQMSREEGKTNAEIARELDIAEKTVEGHMTKALHHLRESLNISLPLLIYLLEK